MHLILVKSIEETSAATEKKEVATKLTDAMVSIKEQNSPAMGLGRYRRGF